MSKSATPRKMPARAAIASWIGTTLEYYDFAVYGTASALVLNQLFFPADMPQGISVLLSMVTFAIGYLVRPLGALILGPLGDRFGRKFVMMITLFGIGACTFIVGCLPTYSQIGVMAPILLVVIRVLQGLSVSGEQASAITMSLEHAPERRRGFTTSFTTSGSASGGLLATAVFIPFAAMPKEALLSWGWRVPFWLSAVVVVVAYIIRRTLDETPTFIETQAIKVQLAPIRQAIRFHWRTILRVAACAMIAGVSYLFATFVVSFATTGYGLNSAIMLWVPACSSFLSIFVTPFAGYLTDLVGRKRIFIIGAFGSGVAAVPYFWAITQGNWALIFTFGIISHGIFYASANAAWPAFFAEMFPNRVRVSGLAVGTQIGFAVSGAIGPVAATALAGADLTNWIGPSILAIALMAISVIAALTAKETYRHTVEEIDDLQQSELEKETVTASILLPSKA